jgi:hypothetical protein
MLTGRDTILATFPKRLYRNHPNRRLLDVQPIPVEKIIGSFNRVSEFDHEFRPLRRHMADRWVNASIALEWDGWSPILVHKIGEEYYVEDGHHRVSVARSTGMVYIEAKVWEYSVQPQRPETCELVRCTEREIVGIYSSLKS